MQTLKGLIKKYQSVISYLFFGACTTAVNWATYALLYNCCGVGNRPSVAVAWLISVLFAYITNKLWVFDSKSFDSRTLLKEIAPFFGARLATGALDYGIMFVAVDCLRGNGNVWKLISNGIVIILNYFASRCWVFQKNH